MKKILKVLGIVSLLIITASQANAGIFSKFRGWSNNFWNNGWGSGRYYNNYNCPYHNHYNSRPHYHGNGFFHSGSMTGFTPPINGSFYRLLTEASTRALEITIVLCTRAI